MNQSMPLFTFLEVGALTALAKPVNIFSPSFQESRKYIIDTLRSLSDIHVIKKPLKIPMRIQDKKPR